VTSIPQRMLLRRAGLKSGLRATTLLSTLLFASASQAHSPVFDCFNDDGGKVTCEGGFSDGTSATGVRVRVLDKDDKVLLEGKIDADGRFTFAKPKADFHVVFDAGAGHSATVFGADIS
jgi:hypothetical protein